MIKRKKIRKRKKKISEFEIFDESMNKMGKNLDKTIIKQSTEIEGKIINYVKNSKARGKLQNKYSEEIDKKKFDDFFNSIEEKKNKAKEYMESNKTKEKCQKLDVYANEFIYSKHSERAINFFDKFNVECTKKFLDEAKDFSPLLDLKDKEEFRKKAKELIEEKLYTLYDKLLEPTLKELVINLCKSVIDIIDKKVKKNKRKKIN